MENRLRRRHARFAGIPCAGRRIHAHLRLACIAVFLLLFPLPAHAAATSAPSLPAAMLASPNETAEEIVLRAHQFDAQAVVLAIVGYSKGIGGFPHEPYIAGAWLRVLSYLGAVEAYAFAMLQRDMVYGSPNEQLGVKAAMCETAHAYTPASLFAQSGVANLETICAEPKKKKEDSAESRKSYEETKTSLDEIKQGAQNIARWLRGFRERPAMPEEWKILHDNVGGVVPFSAMLFYIATDHNPVTSPPDWDALRLLEFMNSQRDTSKKTPVQGDKNSSSAFAPSPQTVEAAIVDGLSRLELRPSQLALLRDAHAGKADAMRAVAKKYQQGRDGFPQNDVLAQTWFQSGALENDTESALFLALSYFRQNQFVPARSWASVALTQAGANPQITAIARQIVNMAETNLGKEALQPTEDLIKEFHGESKKRQAGRSRQ